MARLSVPLTLLSLVFTVAITQGQREGKKKKQLEIRVWFGGCQPPPPHPNFPPLLSVRGNCRQQAGKQKEVTGGL